MWYNDCYEERDKDNHMDDLFNEVIAGFGNPKRAFINYEKNKFNEFRRREERQNLLSAQKFFVSDSLLENAVVASLAQPQALLGMLRQAKPPFNNMWIEWNEKKRVVLIHKHFTSMGLNMEQLDPSSQADRVGYHIKNADDYYSSGITNDVRTFTSDAKKVYPKGCFAYQSYFSFGEKAWIENLDGDRKYKGKIVFPPQSILLNNEDEIMFEKKAEHEQVTTMRHAFGSTYRTVHNKNIILDSLVKHSCFFTHDLLLFGYPKSALQEMMHGNSDQVLEWMKITLAFIEGDIRFIIAVLSLLNYQHHVYERAEMASIPRRIRFGGIVPKNEVRILEIDLPKPFGVKKYEKIFKGFGSPKRQHTRRGHWHTYHYKNGEKRQKWVEEQTVGNAELGKIEHDYILRRRNG